MSAHLGSAPEATRSLELAGLSEKQSGCIQGVAPKNAPTIRWRDKLNPVWIGNADDPEAPDWYRPGKRLRKTMWYLRNPFHNFTFYVLGVADKRGKEGYARCGKLPRDVFTPEPGWNFAYTRYKGLRLPFVSYWNGHAKLYLGWRERGNVGIKANFSIKGKYDDK